MSRRTAGWLAWSVFACYVLLAAATVVLVTTTAATSDQIFVVLAVGFAVAGALVASREPENAVGWVLLGTALSVGLQEVSMAYLTAGYRFGERLAVLLGVQLAWLFLTLVLLPPLFPSGRLLSPRWRVAIWLGALGFALLHLGQAFVAGGLEAEAVLGDEAIARSTGLSGLAVDAGNALLLTSLVLSAAALAVRLRRSHGRERQQLKLFTYVAALAVTAIILGMPSILGGSSTPEVLVVLGTIGWFSALALVLLGLPIAIGVAILRHRLYDIDIVIKRTLVYGTLTAALVAAYLGLVLLFRFVLSPLTGESDLAVAGSTLAVAALFRPLRSRIQAQVDRRFYRARYDAARTADAFSARLRDELDLTTLGDDLRRVVSDTVQPTQVSLWLREAAR